jgi:hypothetical protein
MATVGSIATTPASRGNGTAPPVAPSIAFPPSPWRRRSSPRSWRRWMTGRSSRRRPAVRSRPGTPSIRAVRPNWPACGQPSENGGRPSTGTCGPSRRDGCPSRPAGTPRRAGPRGARVGGTRSDPGSGVRHDSHDGDGAHPGRCSRQDRTGRRRRRSRAAQATAGSGGRPDRGGVPRVHPAVLRRAHGSYACRFAEADGNRTRLSRATAHTGFEDRGTHQDPDASGGSVAARMPELPRQDGHAGLGG